MEEKLRVFCRMRREIEEEMERMKTANTVERQNRWIREIEATISGLKERYPDFAKGHVADMLGTIMAFELHDVTRNEVNEVLALIAEKIDAEIEKLNHEMNVRDVRNILLGLAEHAEEVCGILKKIHESKDQNVSDDCCDCCTAEKEQDSSEDCYDGDSTDEEQNMSKDCCDCCSAEEEQDMCEGCCDCCTAEKEQDASDDNCDNDDNDKPFACVELVFLFDVGCCCRDCDDDRG